MAMKATEKTFIFNLNNDNDTNLSKVKYLDLAQVHNLVNRHFVRQGNQFVIDSIEIGVKPGGDFTASIYRLPQVWPVYNAWEKTFRHWQHQREHEAEKAGMESTRARYSDFKIHMDADHVEAGVAQNLIPIGYSTTDPSLSGEAYEWNMSQVVLPQAGGSSTAHEVYLHMVGDDDGSTLPASTSAGMVKAYALSRSRVFATDPNIVDVDAEDTLYGAMEDVAEITTDIITNYQEHNHVPPYLIGNDGTSHTNEFYPAGSLQGSYWTSSGPATNWGYGLTMVDVLSANANQNYNTDATGGFIAPCGLLRIAYEASNVNVAGPLNVGEFGLGIWMKIKLVPGESKGLMLQSMQEAN